MQIFTGMYFITHGLPHAHQTRSISAASGWPVLKSPVSTASPAGRCGYWYTVGHSKAPLKVVRAVSFSRFCDALAAYLLLYRPRCSGFGIVVIGCGATTEQCIICRMHCYQLSRKCVDSSVLCDRPPVQRLLFISSAYVLLLPFLQINTATVPS